VGKWLWIAAAVLLAAAAASVWFAFQRPDFVAGLVAVAVGALGKALWPDLLRFFRPANQDSLEEWHDRLARGEDFGLPGQRKRPKE
jgi:hypothetical protein